MKKESKKSQTSTFDKAYISSLWEMPIYFQGSQLGRGLNRYLYIFSHLLLQLHEHVALLSWFQNTYVTPGWVPSSCPLGICYLVTICSVKTRGNFLHLHPPPQDPFTKWLISCGKIFPLVIAIACAWDSICLTNEKWLALLHKGISFFGNKNYICATWIMPMK